MAKRLLFLLSIMLLTTTGCTTSEVSPSNEPIPTLISTPTSETAPSPSPNPKPIYLIPYADHVPINEEVMSREERMKLDPIGQEVVALLDDYVFISNNDFPQNYEDKFGAVDPAGNFNPGGNYITIKATSNIVTQARDVFIAADVEIRYTPQDLQPYWKGKQAFQFTTADDGSLRLKNWNETADHLGFSNWDERLSLHIMPNEWKIADIQHNGTTISIIRVLDNGKNGLKVSARFNNGETAMTWKLPTTEAWENLVEKKDIHISALPKEKKAWILLNSDSSAGLMSKSLYEINGDEGNVLKVRELDQEIDGYVTGVAFRDERVGWITAIQHGTELMPLYRTEDGGKSWTLQKLDRLAGYAYGNSYPPVFDAGDLNRGQLVMEYVSNSDRGRLSKRRVKYTTTDGGDTWHTNAVVSIPPVRYLYPDSFNNPTEKQFIQLIVQHVKALNNRDQAAFAGTFSKKTSNQVYPLYKYYTEKDSMIIDMKNPQFSRNEGGQYGTVFVTLVIYELSTNEVSEETRVYSFELEDKGSREWRIGFID
ncbi:hypothetical protein NV379_10950 [Paenibacillus sp. N1-5-1-14]|uniref:hypothetical protein n=1 Tax=Paenibacillus radicibacter TaxID=2972488 RepID=UPI002159317A|nr:hypothetical protein [Paenibacillus radicibacter]MCR8643178.1 hypothetical protein [Paenibacillus radicibacter]